MRLWIREFGIRERSGLKAGHPGALLEKRLPVDQTQETGAGLPTHASPERRSLLLQRLSRFVRHPVGACGGALVLWLIVSAAAAPLLSPHSPITQSFKRLLSPNSQNLLGTDEFGRDIFSRIIFGSRISLEVGVIAVGVALLLGGTLGLMSGYCLGLIDTLVQRVVDILLAIPGVVLIIAISGVIGPSMRTSMLAIGIVYSPAFSRVVRGSTLSVIAEQYVEAARATGAGPLRLILRHILPNVAAPVIVQASLSFSTAILAEATLSYLGLGTQPPEPSWGTMLASGRKFMDLAPGLTVFPGLAIMLAVLGFNLLGDALRDALDPRLQRQ
jgi:peptide/nickel transport system permease protein